MMLDEKWMPRFPHFEATPHDFLAWREQSHSFDQLGTFRDNGIQPLRGRQVRAHFRRARHGEFPGGSRSRTDLGRSFTAKEDTAGNDHVILLGYDLWKQRFAGDAHVVGSVIKLNDVNFTVIGVMPSIFRFPHDAEIWKPMGLTARDFDGGHFLWGIGRLKANVTR